MLRFDSKHKFMFNEVIILAWAASVQRAGLYSPSANYRKSKEFRSRVTWFIEAELLPSYMKICGGAEHVENIRRLVDFGSRRGQSLVGADGYKIGVAQKFLNLLLKYLWCLGHIVEPPHCPVDRIVLEKTSLRGRLNWTQITTMADYQRAIGAISSLGGETWSDDSSMGIAVLLTKVKFGC